MPVQIDSLWFGEYKIGHGLAQYAAFLHEYPFPVGLVWAIELRDDDTDLTRADILWAYTHPDCRRSGVMSTLLDYILDPKRGAVDILSTWAGSSSGKPFMRAYGFTQHPRLCLWTCTRSDRKTRKDKRHASRR